MTPTRQPGPPSRCPFALALVALMVSSLSCSAVGPPPPERPRATVQRGQDEQPPDARPDLSVYTEEDGVPTATATALRQRADAATDLRWLPAWPALGTLLPGISPSRPSVLSQKRRALSADDRAGQARANAVLASEAFTRASLVVRRWLDRRDPTTGLLTTRRPEEGTAGWFYRDTASDLYPHIAIGAWLLFSHRYPEATAVLAVERRLAAAPPSLVDDLLLPDGRRAGRSAEDRMFGAAEFAKDGLLPLVERLGPDPWLGRLLEVADAILASSSTPTPRGPIPASTNEVNGGVLQVLARAYWATGDERYFLAADRIGRAYFEEMLPTTGWLPAHDWDFIDGEPIGRRRLRLSDHGNEIVAGLVSWHLTESLRGEPEAPAHRVGIRRMLDRMLDKGRNPDGLWYRVLEIPSGKVDQDGLSDNWGYLVQAFLAQAAIERASSDGDAARAERYEEAARDALRALPEYAFYPWQRGQMDGYADVLEGVLYLLPRLPDAAAAGWVDEQVAVLFGFQASDGTVEDNYLDGNFVRTALLYGLSLTHGTWPDPWRSDVLVGAATNGSCIEVAATSADAWEGRLRFDTPRHRDYLHLPSDFPRLNEWPEAFTVEAGRAYQVVVDGGEPRRVDGSLLAAGLPLRLEPGAVRSLGICPSR